jgi:hypothetical protein
MWKEAAKVLSVIVLEGLSKTTRNISHIKQGPGRDLNPLPLEYKLESLLPDPIFSVYIRSEGLCICRFTMICR